MVAFDKSEVQADNEKQFHCHPLQNVCDDARKSKASACECQATIVIPFE